MLTLFCFFLLFFFDCLQAVAHDMQVVGQHTQTYASFKSVHSLIPATVEAVMFQHIDIAFYRTVLVS